MKTPLWFCLSAALLAGSAWGIEKCTLTDGRVVYSDLGCPAASKVGPVASPAYKPPAYRPAPGSFRASQLVRKAALEPYKDTIWRDAIARGRIAIGMPADLVRLVWGVPDDINRTVTARGTREQWVYGDIGQRSYVYLDDGEVTAIQN